MKSAEMESVTLTELLIDFESVADSISIRSTIKSDDLELEPLEAIV